MKGFISLHFHVSYLIIAFIKKNLTFSSDINPSITLLIGMISVSGKAFYGIMLWRSRLNTSEVSIRY